MTLKRLGYTALLMGSLFSASTLAADIPTQTLNKNLHDRLPDDVKKTGVMNAVNNGSFPPYKIVNNTHSVAGTSADLAKALGELLGG